MSAQDDEVIGRKKQAILAKLDQRRSEREEKRREESDEKQSSDKSIQQFWNDFNAISNRTLDFI